MATPNVHLQYDSSLPHQVAAVDAVADVFEGALGGAAQVQLADGGAGQFDIVELGFANPAPEDDAALDASLLEQVRVVQRRNGIEPSQQLAGRHFTVEMETGTGKTYVYLRTIFELNKRYGLTKFVVVVPSVAIREGVLASLKSTKPHFTQLYAMPLDYAVYDSKRLSDVRQFATMSTIQVLVMNIQAFQRDIAAADDDAAANVINRPHDAMAGRRPIEFIQAVRPVVILDEPQNFESRAARAAIDRLHPLCTLRYSATPRNAYNLVYRLGPVDAFEQKLVKQIEVDGVEADVTFNSAHVRLLQVDADKNRARIEINAGVGDAAKRVKTWVRRSDDLRVKSRGRPEYDDGFIVNDIVFAPGQESIEFTSQTVSMGAFTGAEVSDVQRMQVRETIRYHLDREARLAHQGIKVLSLFFLDAVADYRLYDGDEPRLGPIGELFEEELVAALARRGDVDYPSIGEVHGGYFSQDSRGRAKDSRGDGEGDRSTYEKIMSGKERLLSLDEPLRFIFTHSALREGWDNPNVFQVCTLTHTRSAITRRQQIGRGLRLPVDQHGARVRDREVAQLTVIANESYEDFARGLQVDYEKEAGQSWGVVPRTAFSGLFVPDDEQPELGNERSVAIWERLQSEEILDTGGRLTAKFTPTEPGFALSLPDGLQECEAGVLTVLEAYDRPLVRNARERKPVRFAKAVTLDPEFQALWADIAGRTRYRVSIDSEAIVREAASAIREMVPVPRALVQSRSAQLDVTGAGVRAGDETGGRVKVVEAPSQLPDILSSLQNSTELTRVTLARILNECGRLDDFRINPHAFGVEVTRIIRRVLVEQVVDGIEYERIDGALWEMRRLEPEAADEITRYVDRLYEVRNAGKSPYSHVEWESSVEKAFAERLDRDDRVRFFVKLPSWFTVDTPAGLYNPDWAICWDDGDHPRIHLVRETKSTQDELMRRPIENAKIACAARHFNALGTDYQVATSFDDLVAQTAGTGV